MENINLEVYSHDDIAIMVVFKDGNITIDRIILGNCALEPTLKFFRKYDVPILVHRHTSEAS